MRCSSPAKTVLCLAVLVGCALASPARAEVSTFRWDLGDHANPAGIGGTVFFFLVGPLDGTIVNTRIIAEFVTADAWDVSNLEIQLQGPVEHVPGETWTVLDLWGADLGWSGVGHFQTEFETDALNGPLAVQNNVSVWLLDLNDGGNLFFGRYLDLRIELDVEGLVFDFECLGDLDGDGALTGMDLRLFQLGPCPATGETCFADLDGDGVVTRDDRNSLIGMLGGICPVAP